MWEEMWMNRSTMTWVLLILLTTPIASGFELADGSDLWQGGRQASRATITIDNVYDLQNMSKDLTASYVLANDIDASETVNWNFGAGFSPVGTGANRFTGSLDGQGHSIKGLYINRPTTDNVSLLGYIDTGSKVKNVGVVDSNVTGNRSVGGLVGCSNHGSVDNSYATGNVFGNNWNVGGLVGYNYYGSVTWSYAIVNVTGRAFHSGGLVGYNEHGTVDDSHATGAVNGTDYGGGLVGVNRQGWVKNSFSRGNVNAPYAAGGLIGSIQFGTLDYGESTGKVSGSSRTGGLVGYNDRGKMMNSVSSGDVTGHIGAGGLVGKNTGIVLDSYSTGNVNATGHYIGGLVGDNTDGNVTNSHYNIIEVLINGERLATRGGLFGLQYIDWISRGLSLDISYYSYSLAPSGDYFTISDYRGLQDLLGFADNPIYKFRLAADLDLYEAPGYCIPYLKAEFDGANHTISNLDIDMPFASVLGMFGFNDGGTIRNIGIENINVNGYDNAGGLVGYNNYGAVDNAFVKGNVNASWSNVGGLVGYNDHGTVNNSRADMNVTESYRNVGGLVGYNNHSMVNNSHATGNVTGDSSEYGGLVGNNVQSVVNNSYATGNVIGRFCVGGLVGSNDHGTVNNSYATGNIHGSYYYTGGLVGDNWRGALDNSYSSGNVTGNNSVGGLLGANTQGTVNNSYATGNVNGNSSIGGFIGLNNGTVHSAYATGKVTGNATIGGFVGNTSNGTAADCFWDKETSGQSSSDGGTGKTTAEMKTLRTFADAGWNFDSIWCMVQNVTYPILRWQETDIPIADAGPNIAINEDQPVTFDGGGSSDEFGIADYCWTFLDVVPITIHGVRPTYLFVNPGIFTVTLEVTDAVGHRDSDKTAVTVIDITAPIADAGPDQIVDEGTLVTMNGSGSSDNAGIVKYTWKFSDGPPVELYGVQRTYRFLTPGIFVVTLNVTDAAGNWNVSTTIITVLDITAPVVDAGPDQTVDEGALVVFDGSGSTDNVGIVNYTWTFSDRAQVALHGDRPSYRFDHPGVFVLTLTVTDAAGNWKASTMTVNVRDITPPVANAGPDQNVNEGTVVVFDGSGSSDSGDIVNYTWAFDYGNSSIMVYGISPTFKFDVPGVYFVTLNVSDAAGHRHDDVMTLIVKDITPPAADAGQDQRVPVGSRVDLNGSRSTDNDRIATYLWNFNYNGEAQSLAGREVSFEFGKGGVYEGVLTVVDRAGNFDEDRINITVVDTGRVTGIVVDKDGQSISGATVFITASNGNISSTRTDANGAFSMDIYHGNFTWKITKNGYQPISGSSSVKPMDVVQLDLSKKPMEKVEGLSLIFTMLVLVIAIAAVLGIVGLVIRRKKRGK